MSVSPQVTEAARPPRGEQPSTGALLSGAAHDLSELLDRQWAMAKLEVKSEVRRAKQAAVLTGVGAGVGLVALVLLSLAFVAGLSHLVPAWAAYLIVGVAAALVSVGLTRYAADQAKGANMLPDRTIKTLSEE